MLRGVSCRACGTFEGGPKDARRTGSPYRGCYVDGARLVVRVGVSMLMRCRERCTEHSRKQLDTRAPDAHAWTNRERLSVQACSLQICGWHCDLAGPDGRCTCVM
eukprot:2434997-Prymnesium_polylepis.1